MKKLITLALLSGTLIGCENPLSTMGEMKDTTGDMSKTTSDMKETMDKMNRTMSQMDINMANMYRQVRQKESEDTRSKQISILNDKKTDMGTKLTAAKKYYMAQEYQLWNGIGFDTKEYREIMILDAVEELYRYLTDYYSDYRSTSPVELEKANNGTKVFYAMATTLHFNNSNQELLAKTSPEVEKLSLLDLIKSALIKNYNHERLTEIEGVIVSGQNLKISEKLLNARMNFLSALALKDMITKNNMSTRNMARGLLFQISNGSLGSIRLDSKFQYQNHVTQEDIMAKLEEAVKTKHALEKVDVKVRMDKTIKSILRNFKLPSQNGDQQNEQNDQILDLVDQLSK